MIVCCQQILENVVIWCEWIWVFLPRNEWHVNSNKSDTYTAVAINSNRSYFLSLGNNKRQFCHDIFCPMSVFFFLHFLRVCFYRLYTDVKPKNTPLDVTMTMTKTNMTRNRRAKKLVRFSRKLTSTNWKNGFAEFLQQCDHIQCSSSRWAKQDANTKKVLIAVQNDCVLRVIGKRQNTFGDKFDTRIKVASI